MSARLVLCHLLLIATLIGSNLLGLLPRGPTTGFVSEAHAASVSPFLDSEDFTFVAWVYWERGYPWQRIFEFGQDPMRNMYLTPASDANTLRFAITTNGYLSEEQLNYSGPLPHGKWVHVAVTLDGDSGQLYVDGVSVDSQTITLNPSDIAGSQRWLAKSQYDWDPTFNGGLDEVAVFDRALSQTEIQGIIADGWDSLPGQTLALHMEENPATDGTLIADSSGQGNHGRLVTADGYNKSGPGHVGQALSFDGVDDYLALRTTVIDTPALELRYIDSFDPVWMFADSAGNVVTFYKPVVPIGFYALGHYGRGGIGTSLADSADSCSLHDNWSQVRWQGQ